MTLGKAAALLVLAASLPGGGGAARGEIVDRIVAVVDQTLLGSPATAGQIVTWSAAYEEACYHALLTGADPPQDVPAQPLSGPLREAVSRIIDQKLLEQAMLRSPFAPSGDDDATGRLAAIRNRYPDIERFQQALRRYRLTEEELAARLRRESQLMAFVTATLRPDVRVTAEQVENYYQSTFLPAYRNRADSGGGLAVPPLDEVREQILEVLIEQETNQRLEQWLTQLRRSARIELRWE